VRYRGILAYDGRAYLGFQRQAEGTPTVQGAVEKAITRIVGAFAPIMGAGRTDTGVHATGQVIVFDAPMWRHDPATLLRAINTALPDDIALQDLTTTSPDFHPRFAAQSRMYRYSVLQCNPRQPLQRYLSWQIHKPLDVDAMQAAAALLLGEHDFATFGNPPQGTNTVRRVFASSWARLDVLYGVELIYTVQATAFLHHMVRRMVGMQVDVGRGWLTLADFECIFRSADLAQAKTMAPPQGLTLVQVQY
jgi:tRNA pseudouridine38-40 synthase